MTSANANVPLLDVTKLSVDYASGWRRPPLRAVDDVSLMISRGETVGLVGESGSGKSTIGRAILGLTPTTSGHIHFDGNDITNASYRDRRRLSADLQAVFQDPNSSLNPTRTVGQTLGETLLAQGRRPADEVRSATEEMLLRVGLAADAAKRYPASFSGGQRQRIAIARALIARPRLVVCDEPLSALDLSVQAQIINLLRQLQRELSLAYLFIAHDLAVVQHISHRIVVLYRGRVMESGSADAVYRRPAHPYTQALLAAAPIPEPEVQKQRRLKRLAARVPLGTITGPTACPFAPRCPHAEGRCITIKPTLEPTLASSEVACHRWREIEAASEALAPQPANDAFRLAHDRR